MTDDSNVYDRMYGPLTYLDFLLKASEDLMNFDIIREYRLPAQVRYAPRTAGVREDAQRTVDA